MDIISEDTTSELRALYADEDKRFASRFGSDRRRRVLLIGGGGYIGSPVAAELLRAGFLVRNLDLFLFNTQSSVSGLVLDSHYELIKGDFCDTEILERALLDVTDVVVLAGLVGDPVTKKYPSESHQINEIGINRCLSFLQGHGLNKVIFVSTCSNYGLMEGDKLADEDSQLSPLSLYAKAKVQAEQNFLAMKDAVDFHGTVLRFATAFGAAPRMRFDLTVNEFTRELFLGNQLVVYDAQTWRPYCHVRDFARLIRRVLVMPVERLSFEVFNAGGDANNHTKQGIVDIILKMLPDGRVSYQQFGSDPRNYRVDFRKLRERLLFEPAYSVEDGIDELLALLKCGFFADCSDQSPFYGNYMLDYRPPA